MELKNYKPIIPAKLGLNFKQRYKKLKKKAPPGEQAISYCGLAYFNAAIQQFSEAQTFYRKALEMWLKIHGREDPNLSLFLNDLALTYEAQGNFKEAENWFDKAASILKRIYGTEDERTLEVLSRQADTFIGIGKHNIAQRYYKKILEIREKHPNPNHSAIIATLYDLSKTCRSIKKAKDAEEIDKRWIQLFLQANNLDYKRCSNLFNQLGELNYVKKNFLMAEFLYFLAESLREQQRHDESTEALDKAISIIEKLNSETTTSALIYFCKAKIALEKGNKEQAENYFKKTMIVFDKRDHPSKPLIIRAYSKFLTDNQRQAEADQLNEELKEIEKQLKHLTA